MNTEIFPLSGGRSIAQYINRELVIWDMCELFMFLRACHLCGANSYLYNIEGDEYSNAHSITFKDGSKLYLQSLATGSFEES